MMKLTHPTQFNVSLAAKVLDQVITHPNQHDQHTFFYDGYDDCGTIGCIAGWAYQFSGEKGIFDNDGLGIEVERPAVARRVLGLTRAEFQVFYDEMDRGQAIDILVDYLAQGIEAQAPPPTPTPEPEEEDVDQVRELVNA